MGKRTVDPKFKISTTSQEYLFVVDNWAVLTKIQSELTACTAGERSAAASPSSQRSAAPSPGSGSSSPAIRHGSVPPNGKSAPIRKPNPKTLEIRKELLVRDKNLADRHKTLVLIEKCITEEEFWDQRRVNVAIFIQLSRYSFISLFFKKKIWYNNTLETESSEGSIGSNVTKEGKVFSNAYFTSSN